MRAIVIGKDEDTLVPLDKILYVKKEEQRIIIQLFDGHVMTITNIDKYEVDKIYKNIRKRFE